MQLKRIKKDKSSSNPPWLYGQAGFPVLGLDEEVAVIHLRARVRCEKDGRGLNNERAGSQETSHMPIPQWLEIEQGIKGFLLVHVYLREGPFVHTWHDTVEEAKAEAKADFGIGENEWAEVPSEALEK